MSNLDPLVDLQAREQHYRALLDALPDLLFRVDRGGTYLEAWPEDRPDLILRGSQLVGLNVRDVLPPDLVARLQRVVDDVCETGELGVIEYDLEVSGRQQTFEARVVRCAVDEVLAMIRNVSARKRSEAEVRDLQRALQERLVELQASRARIVEAADTERRRLERDIHDGAQQRLLATRLSLKLATERLRRGDPDGAQAVIVDADRQLEAAVDELRALAHGIHPAVLTDEGIGAALEVLARRSPVRVELTTTLESRLPPAVETAVYFLACEALTNVAKHANASKVVVTLRQYDDGLEVIVDDDGLGGADEGHGSGLRGLRDRVEALGGEMALESAAEGGTRLRARIPCG